MIRRPPRSTPKPSSAASDVYKRQILKVRISENRPIERPIIAKILAFDEKLFPDLGYK